MMPTVPKWQKKDEESRKDIPTNLENPTLSLSERLKQSLPANPEYAPIPTKEEAEEFGWVKKRLTIVWIKGETQLTKITEGEALGGIAVYASLHVSKKIRWSVGCVTNGLWMLDVDTEDDAKRIGEILFSKCCMAFMGKTQKAILDKLPGWVRPWIIACRKKFKFIDPQKWVTESEEGE